MDILIIDIAYRCSEGYAASCNVARESCQNLGILQQDCSCRCRPGTSGDHCETVHLPYNVAMHDHWYPDVARVTEAGTELISTDNNAYEVQKWDIEAPACQSVKLQFDEFALVDCDNQYVMLVTNGVDQKYCNSELAGQSVTSTGNRMRVVWASFGSPESEGFVATVSFVADPNC